MVNCVFNGATKLAIQFQDALQRLDFPGFSSQFVVFRTSTGAAFASHSSGQFEWDATGINYAQNPSRSRVIATGNYHTLL